METHISFPSSKLLNTCPYLEQINPVHTTPSYVSVIHLIASTHLRLCVPSGQFSSASLYNIPLWQYPSHPIIHGLTILIILDEEYSSWSFSLCSFIQLSVISSIFGANVLVSTLFSNTHSTRMCSSINSRSQISHPYRTTEHYCYCFGSAAFCWALATSSVSWSYAQSIGLLDRGSTCQKATQTQNKYTQPSKPRVGFETRTPVFERKKRAPASDLAASVITRQNYSFV
jgi:hypothetical protein